MFDIEFYEDKNGKSEVYEYIKELNKSNRRDRILFASWCNNKFVLLSVFMKQTQKTPQSEIEKAQKLLEDYKKRSE